MLDKDEGPLLPQVAGNLFEIFLVCLGHDDGFESCPSPLGVERRREDGVRSTKVKKFLHRQPGLGRIPFPLTDDRSNDVPLRVDKKDRGNHSNPVSPSDLLFHVEKDRKGDLFALEDALDPLRIFSIDGHEEDR